MSLWQDRRFLGCGLAAGIVALAIVVVGVGATLRLRSVLEPVARAQESWETLTEAYGDVGDYAPRVHEPLPAQRIQVYLAVRERMLARQGTVDSLLAAGAATELPDPSFWSALRASFGAVGRVVEPLAEYVDARHRILTDLGMGPGEYAWIATTVSHSWLGNDPARTALREDGSPSFPGPDAFLGPAANRARYVRTVRTLLHNALLVLTAAPDHGREHPDTRALARELELLETRPGRVLWSDGVPPALAASFEPFRARLAASCNSRCEALEWPLLGDPAWSED